MSALAHRLALLFFAVLLSSHAWAINKCTGADGKVVYQDTPCVGEGKKITVQPPSGMGGSDVDRALEELRRASDALLATPKSINAASVPSAEELIEKHKKEGEAALAKAHASCTNGVPPYPAVGMSETDFENCTTFGVLTTPSSINTTETISGIRKQYVYRDSYDIKFVYTSNGRVTAIQR